MNRSGWYYTYSEWLRARYDCKVYKLPVNLPLSCPVRDGSKGFDGCAFCSGLASGYEVNESGMELAAQIKTNAAYIKKKYGAQKFEIFFQTFTNTYANAADFGKHVEDALSCEENCVLLSISTRPDCIAAAHLDLLKSMSEKYKTDITIELGLQSVNHNTLRLLERGHTLSEYIGAVNIIKEYGFFVCTHMITTLPWDSDEDVVEAAKILSVLKTDSVKLHTLYIEKNTKLAAWYEEGRFKMLSLEQFIKRTADFLEFLSPQIAVQRLSARVPEELSVFANWGRSHWVLKDMVVGELAMRGSYQGIKYTRGHDSGLLKFQG